MDSGQRQDIYSIGDTPQLQMSGVMFCSRVACSMPVVPIFQ